MWQCKNKALTTWLSFLSCENLSTFARKSVIFQLLIVEPGRYKDIVVEVERSTQKKPFLGGYRHKQTHVEFHHASAQTGQKVRTVSDVER